MGIYTLEEMVKRWEQGTLTSEQMIGQLLLNLQLLSKRVGTLERVMMAQRQESTGATPTGK